MSCIDGFIRMFLWFGLAAIFWGIGKLSDKMSQRKAKKRRPEPRRVWFPY
jgi:hypothetical protein